jgi:7-keto-8-aminopelargonate synthetase-like enzyme
LPLPLANAALASLRIYRSRGAGSRARLNKNAEYVKFALEQAGFSIPAVPGPIIPFHPKSQLESLAFKKHLLGAGIFPPFLKYPGGDADGYFRFVISSEHTRAQLDTLINTLRSFNDSQNAH